MLAESEEEMKTEKESELVYSTEYGRMCPGCSKPKPACICKRRKESPKGDGIVRVGRETKGRKGNGVTLITGVPLDLENLTQLARQLKQKCGTGGTIKNGVIEIQGDHRDVIVAELTRQGFVVKRSGG